MRAPSNPSRSRCKPCTNNFVICYGRVTVPTTNRVLQATFPRPDSGFLRIGTLLIDLGGHRIVDADVERKLTPKAVAVLIVLAHAHGRTISADELLDRVWTGTCPTVDVVRQIIRELRRALDGRSGDHSVIETIPRAGYRLVADYEFLDTGPTPGSSGHARGNHPRLRFRLLAIAAIGLMALIAAMATGLLQQRGSTPAATTAEPSPSPSTAPTVQPEVTMITSQLNRDERPRLSTDGSRVAYVSHINADVSQIRIVGIDGAGDTALSHQETGRAGSPAWSRDGLNIAYFHWSDQYCRVIVAAGMGGSERGHDVCLPNRPGSLEWFPDGSALLLSLPAEHEPGAMELRRLDLQSGQSTLFSDHDSVSMIDHMPRFSPDGQWLAVRRGNHVMSELWLMSVADDAPPRLLLAGAGSLLGHGWRPDGGSLVFSTNANGHPALHEISLDTLAIQPLGIDNAIAPSSSGDDTIIFQRTLVRVGLGVGSADGSTDKQVLHPSTGDETDPRYSPDGRFLAFTSNRNGRWQVWVHDREHDNLFALTRLLGGRIMAPSWDDAGRRLLIPAFGNGVSTLYEADVIQQTGRVLWRGEHMIESAAYGDDDSVWLALGDTQLFLLNQLTRTDDGMALRSFEIPVSQLTPGPDPDHLLYREPRTGELRILRTNDTTSQPIALPFRPWQWQWEGRTLHLLAMPELGQVASWRYNLDGLEATNEGASLAFDAGVPLTRRAAARDPKTGLWIITVRTEAHDNIAIATLQRGGPTPTQPLE